MTVIIVMQIVLRCVHSLHPIDSVLYSYIWPQIILISYCQVTTILYSYFCSLSIISFLCFRSACMVSPHMLPLCLQRFLWLLMPLLVCLFLMTWILRLPPTNLQWSDFSHRCTDGSFRGKTREKCCTCFTKLQVIVNTQHSVISTHRLEVCCSDVCNQKATLSSCLFT